MGKIQKSLSLFSEETLNSVAMAEIMGGDTVNNCHGANCHGNCVTGCGGSGNSSSNCNEN